ncbi:hypothetical protein OK074_4586 [Actinobacteria bacterium OK074]|nr:hypothetical protein OK074_4586 [Actinobacteria bacterium OK074]
MDLVPVSSKSVSANLVLLSSGGALRGRLSPAAEHESAICFTALARLYDDW